MSSKQTRALKQREELNGLIDELASRIPMIPRGAPLPKQKILRLAALYIHYLGLLAGGQQIPESYFKNGVQSILSSRKNHSALAKREIERQRHAEKKRLSSGLRKMSSKDSQRERTRDMVQDVPVCGTSFGTGQSWDRDSLNQSIDSGISSLPSSVTSSPVSSDCTLSRHSFPVGVSSRNTLSHPLPNPFTVCPSTHPTLSNHPTMWMQNPSRLPVNQYPAFPGFVNFWGSFY